MEKTATKETEAEKLPKKRALVVGAQVKGLRGVEGDTLRVEAMLKKRGFDVVDRRVGARATRAGILEGYDALIKDSREGDTAVVYYGGHGFFASVSGVGPRSWQCIVPTDIDSSTVDDWRGITAWELSIKQAQLTAKTKNVTVILDCCCASQMSRDSEARGAVPRALPNPVTAGLELHLAGLRKEYGEADLAAAALVNGNPDSVRLVACGESESAYEVLEPSLGAVHGVFTSSLLEILEEVGDTPVSWAAIADAIRARVLRRFPMQRPEVEGPRDRELFSLTLQDGKEHVSVRVTKQGYELPVGRLTGVTLGDVYGIMRLGAQRYDSATALAQLEVTAVQALSSIAEWKCGAKEFPVDALAFPIVRNATRRAVRLEAPEALRSRLAQDLAATPTLRLADAGEPAIATLKLDNDALTIEDAAGPLFTATRFPEELPGTLKNLANLGVAQGIREILGEHGVYARELSIELCLLEGGDLRTLPESGSSLALGDRICVKIESKARRRLYLHVFNVGVRSIVSLLSEANPAGVALDKGDEPYVLGQAPNGSFVGQPLLWPQGLPRSPRIDELVIIATTAKVNLTGLITRDAFGNHRFGGGAKLSDQVAQLQDGLTRDVGEGAPLEGFYAKRLSFMLHPLDAALSGVAPATAAAAPASRDGR